MVVKSVGALGVAIGLATGWLYSLYLFSGPDERLKFPRNLDQLKGVKGVLDEYAREQLPFTLVFFCSAYLYKQTFAIPGSVFLNLLAGALFGVGRGFLLCCLLSAVGASMCFLLSKMFGKALLIRYAPQRVSYFQEMVRFLRDEVGIGGDDDLFKDLISTSEKEGGLFKLLVSLRVFPMTPNWLINVSSPIVGVPLKSFFLSALLGLAPYNFLTCNAGSTLAELKSLDDVMSWRVGIGLGLLALGIINPHKMYKKLMGKSS